MQISTAVTAFLQQRRTRSRAASTIGQYRYQLQNLWQPWRAHQRLPDDLASVMREELDAYFRYLAEEHVNVRTGQVGLSRETINSSWRTLRTFWHFAASQRWLSDAQRSYFQGRAGRLPHQPVPPASASAQAALRDALLATCVLIDNPEVRARNRALLWLLGDGLRISELVALRDTDVDLRERCARISRAGGRMVVLGWGYHTAVALRAYMCVRSGGRGGPLLRSTYGQHAGQPLSASAVRRIIGQLSRLAGVEVPLRVLASGQRRRVLWSE